MPEDVERGLAVVFAVEEVVVVELNGVGTPSVTEIRQRAREALGCVDDCLAVPHGDDAAEFTAVTATQRKLVHRRACSHERRTQVRAHVPEAFVRNERECPRRGNGPLEVVDRYTRALPAQTKNALDRRRLGCRIARCGCTSLGELSKQFL